MKRRGARRAAWRAGVVVVVATAARADAPGDQYGLFDSNTVDFIQDNWTHLSWQRYPPAQLVTFDQAATYCENLALGKFQTGWRVPSYKELLTLVDESPHTEYELVGGTYANLRKLIDIHPFPGTPVDHDHWSSSPVLPSLHPNQPDVIYAYTVAFGTGEAGFQDVTSTQYVRCVHDPQ
jgi:hypothetical protein